MTVAQDLMDMKKDIDRAKTKKAETEGAVKQLMKQLKQEFACSDLAAAKKKLNHIRDKIKKMQAELEAGVQKLEEEYEL